MHVQSQCFFTGFCGNHPGVHLGFDRLDSAHRGYPMGDGVVPCLTLVNYMKDTMSATEFRSICADVGRTWGPSLIEM